MNEQTETGRNESFDKPAENLAKEGEKEERPALSHSQRVNAFLTALSTYENIRWTVSWEQARECPGTLTS